MTPDMGRTTLISVKDQVPCCLGEWYRRDIPRRPNDFPMQYLRSICELRLMYHRRTLASTMTLLSPHRPEENDVTLVTTCTPDRLNRLECVVEAWDGPVCVAIYYRRRIGCKFTSCMHLKSKLKMWHSAFCKQNKIVDISLLVDEQQHLQHIVPMEPITSVDQAHDCSMDTLLWKKYRFVPLYFICCKIFSLLNTCMSLPAGRYFPILLCMQVLSMSDHSSSLSIRQG